MRKISCSFLDGYVKPVLEDGLPWVEALRSGKYRQGATLLCSDRGNGEAHCCLGVWCEVKSYKKAELTRDLVAGTGNTKIFAFGESKEITRPRDKTLLDWGTFPTGATVQIDRDTYWNFIDLNDQAKMTFSEIADVAEQLYQLT